MSYRSKHIKPKIKSLRKKRQFYKMPVFWFFLLFLIIITSFFYFILFFPKFQVTKITILGNEKVQRNDIENLVSINVNKKILNIIGINITTKSIFTINSKKIVEDVLNKFPNIHEVKIEKDLPNSIILKVKERSPFAIFCPDFVEDSRLQGNRNQKDCFFIDYNGVIFENAPSLLNNTILKKELGNREIYLGENIIEKSIIDIISKIKNGLKDNFQIDIKKVFISNILIFETSLGFKIYFNRELDIDLQILKMNTLLRDEITIDERENLQYIYLQYKDRAYFK